MPNRLPSSSEMLLFSIHVGIEGPGTLLCNRAKGKLQRGRKAPADFDMADSNYQHNITHCGGTQAYSNNPTRIPKSGPREIVLLLKCKMVMLSLVESIFEKHKVLFI